MQCFHIGPLVVTEHIDEAESADIAPIENGIIPSVGRNDLPHATVPRPFGIHAVLERRSLRLWVFLYIRWFWVQEVHSALIGIDKPQPTLRSDCETHYAGVPCLDTLDFIAIEIKGCNLPVLERRQRLCHRSPPALKVSRGLTQKPDVRHHPSH